MASDLVEQSVLLVAVTVQSFGLSYRNKMVL